MHLESYLNVYAKGNGEQGKMEEIGCEIICGVPAILAVKRLMMMMMMIMTLMMYACTWQVT